MTGTSTNYTGRQLDVELLQRVARPVDQRVFPSVDAVDQSGPGMCSGMQKTVQRFAKLLLTELGSVKGGPEVGGELMSLVRTGTMSTEAYMRFMIEVSSKNAVDVMELDDLDGRFGATPDDERLVGTQLVSLLVDEAKGEASAVIRLETAAGTDYRFIIPVATGRSAA